MTLKKKLPTRNKTEALTEDQIMYLVSGPTIIDWADRPFENEAEALGVYQRFKNRISKRVAVCDELGRTPDDLFTNVLPGCKPWAWFAERGLRFPYMQDQPKVIAEWEKTHK